MSNKEISPGDEPLIKQLLHDIHYHDLLYYKHDRQIITDGEYDNLVKQFEFFQKKYPWLGLPLGVKGGTILHRYPMLSIANSYDIKEVSKALLNPPILAQHRTKHGATLLSNVPVDMENFIVAEYKIDGMAVELQYVEGELTMAVIRGDGIYGDDVTANMKLISSIPNTIKELGFVTIYGEVAIDAMSYDMIQRSMVKLGKQRYSSRRNAAAGIGRGNNTTAISKLSFLPYTTYAANVHTQQESYDFLQANGFKFAHFVQARMIALRNRMVSSSVFDGVANGIEKDRDRMEFDIDGVVFKLNHFAQRELVGCTRRHPRWAFAYKFKAKLAETTITGVDYTMGKTGIITPVALLVPVKLLGRTVSRASLANFNKIAEKDIMVFDSVMVSLAMDVIPFVEYVLPKRPDNAYLIELPNNCPFCGKTTTYDQDTGILRCTNSMCVAMITKRFKYICCRKVLDIKGMGDKTITALHNEGVLASPADIFTLHHHAELMTDLFGEKRTVKLLAMIERRKTLTINQFLQLSSIVNLSTAIADNVAHSALTMEALLYNFNDIFAHKLEGIGEVVQRDLTKFLAGDAHVLYKQLIAAGVIIKDMIPSPKVKGFHVAITGKLQNISRDELIHYIQEKGGTYHSTLSRKVSMLVVGDSPGSKLTKAKELDIVIFTEDELFSELDTWLDDLA